MLVHKHSCWKQKWVLNSQQSLKSWKRNTASELQQINSLLNHSLQLYWASEENYEKREITLLFLALFCWTIILYNIWICQVQGEITMKSVADLLPLSDQNKVFCFFEISTSYPPASSTRKIDRLLHSDRLFER